MISDLSRMADTHNAVLLKANTDARNFGSQRDLYYFSSTAPSTAGLSPAVDSDGSISWLFEGLRGRLLPASAMGDAPLSGDYHVSDDASLEQNLTQWAAELGLTLRYQRPVSVLALLNDLLLQSGLGISYLSVLLLTLALVLTDVFNRSYLRSVQLLNGVEPRAIKIQQMARVFAAGLPGVAAGAALGSIYCLALVSAALLRAIAVAALPYLLGGLTFLALATCVVVRIFTPSVELIRTRRLPSGRFRRFNKVLQVAAVAVCVVAGTTAVSLGRVALNSYQLASSAQVLGDAVSVSIGSFDYLDTEEGSQAAQAFLSDPDIAASAVLCVNVGSHVQLLPEDLGGYGEVDIVNQSFLDLAEVPESALTPVDWNSLPETLRVQLSLYLVRGTDPLQAYRPLRLNSKTDYFSLDANAGFGGDIRKPDNPLIVLLEGPLTQFTVTGFLVPLMSTGNLIFTNAEQFKAKLYTSPLAPSVASVERAADAGLVTAQDFKAAAGSYATAIVCSLLLAGISAWQAALIWARSRRRHILLFTLSGVAASRLWRTAFVRSLLLTLLVSVLGAMLAAVRAGISGSSNAAISVLLLMAVFSVVSWFSYKINVRRVFDAAVARKV